MTFSNRSWKEELQRVAARAKFEATLKPRVTAAIEDWQATQPPVISEPETIEHEPDSELQTGESLKLGGAMQIKAQWARDESSN